MRLKGKEIYFVSQGDRVGTLSGALEGAKVVGVKNSGGRSRLYRSRGLITPVRILIGETWLGGHPKRLERFQGQLYKPSEKTTPVRQLSFGPGILYKIGNCKIEKMFGPDWSKWPLLILKMRFLYPISEAAQQENKYREFLRGLNDTKGGMLKAVEKLFRDGLIRKNKPIVWNKSKLNGIFRVEYE